MVQEILIREGLNLPDGPGNIGVSLFTGLDYWTGLLDWTTGPTFEPTNSVSSALYMAVGTVWPKGDGPTTFISKKYPWLVETHH